MRTMAAAKDGRRAPAALLLLLLASVAVLSLSPGRVRGFTGGEWRPPMVVPQAPQYGWEDVYMTANTYWNSFLAGLGVQPPNAQGMLS